MGVTSPGATRRGPPTPMNDEGAALGPVSARRLSSQNRAEVRTNCARELMVAGRPSGYAFAATAIEENAPYKREMAQAVRDRFPELRTASDAEVAAFIRQRAR